MLNSMYNKIVPGILSMIFAAVILQHDVHVCQMIIQAEYPPAIPVSHFKKYTRVYSVCHLTVNVYTAALKKFAPEKVLWFYILDKIGNVATFSFVFHFH